MNIIKNIEEKQLKKKVPAFRVGDTVTVSVKILEEGKEREQAFSGIVIARQGADLKESFTVRHVSGGYGVEKVFLLHSPRVVKIKVLRSGKVRRAKLYYLRERVGKRATKVKEKVESKVKKISQE